MFISAKDSLSKAMGEGGQSGPPAEPKKLASSSSPVTLPHYGESTSGKIATNEHFSLGSGSGSDFKVKGVGDTHTLNDGQQTVRTHHTDFGGEHDVSHTIPEVTKHLDKLHKQKYEAFETGKDIPEVSGKEIDHPLVNPKAELLLADRHGPAQTYSKRGNLIAHTNFKNGVPDGPQHTYADTPNGQLISTTHYSDGDPVSSKQEKERLTRISERKAKKKGVGRSPNADPPVRTHHTDLSDDQARRARSQKLWDFERPPPSHQDTEDLRRYRGEAPKGRKEKLEEHESLKTQRKERDLKAQRKERETKEQEYRYLRDYKGTTGKQLDIFVRRHLGGVYPSWHPEKETEKQKKSMFISAKDSLMKSNGSAKEVPPLHMQRSVWRMQHWLRGRRIPFNPLHIKKTFHNEWKKVHRGPRSTMTRTPIVSAPEATLVVTPPPATVKRKSSADLPSTETTKSMFISAKDSLMKSNGGKKREARERAVQLFGSDPSASKDLPTGYLPEKPPPTTPKQATQQPRFPKGFNWAHLDYKKFASLTGLSRKEHKRLGALRTEVRDWRAAGNQGLPPGLKPKPITNPLNVQLAAMKKELKSPKVVTPKSTATVERKPSPDLSAPETTKSMFISAQDSLRKANDTIQQINEAELKRINKERADAAQLRVDKPESVREADRLKKINEDPESRAIVKRLTAVKKREKAAKVKAAKVKAAKDLRNPVYLRLKAQKVKDDKAKATATKLASIKGRMDAGFPEGEARKIESMSVAKLNRTPWGGKHKGRPAGWVPPAPKPVVKPKATAVKPVIGTNGGDVTTAVRGTTKPLAMKSMFISAKDSLMKSNGKSLPAWRPSPILAQLQADRVGAVLTKPADLGRRERKTKGLYTSMRRYLEKRGINVKELGTYPKIKAAYTKAWRGAHGPEPISALAVSAPKPVVSRQPISSTRKPRGPLETERGFVMPPIPDVEQPPLPPKMEPKPTKKSMFMSAKDSLMKSSGNLTKLGRVEKIITKYLVKREIDMQSKLDASIAAYNKAGQAVGNIPVDQRTTQQTKALNSAALAIKRSRNAMLYAGYKPGAGGVKSGKAIPVGSKLKRLEVPTQRSTTLLPTEKSMFISAKDSLMKSNGKHDKYESGAKKVMSELPSGHGAWMDTATGKLIATGAIDEPDEVTVDAPSIRSISEKEQQTGYLRGRLRGAPEGAIRKREKAKKWWEKIFEKYSKSRMKKSISVPAEAKKSVFISAKDSLSKAVLTTEDREDLKQKQFALPKKAEDKEEKGESGNYPIPDLSHARNALAMVARYGSSSEQAKVRAAVYKKYPELDKRKEEEHEKSMFISAKDSLMKGNVEETETKTPHLDALKALAKKLGIPKGTPNWESQVLALAKKVETALTPALEAGSKWGAIKEGKLGYASPARKQSVPLSPMTPSLEKGSDDVRTAKRKQSLQSQLGKSLDPALAARMNMKPMSTLGAMGSPVLGQVGFHNTTIGANFSKGHALSFDEKTLRVLKRPNR